MCSFHAQIVITFVYYLHIYCPFVEFFLSIVFARNECSLYILKNHIHNNNSICSYFVFIYLLASVSTSSLNQIKNNFLYIKSILAKSFLIKIGKMEQQTKKNPIWKFNTRMFCVIKFIYLQILYMKSYIKKWLLCAINS